jgi:hypothetical protein
MPGREKIKTTINVYHSLAFPWPNAGNHLVELPSVIPVRVPV